MKYFSLIALMMLLVPFSAQAQEEQANVDVTQVKNNIYLLVSPKGGNVIASIGDDGAFLIDDQLAGRSAIIDIAVKEISDRDIKFVLNTHYHFDHTGGNEFFGKKDAIIVAHDNVRKRLNSKQFITYFKREMAPLSKAGLPVVTFSEGMTLHYNGDDIQIIHVPAAHTDGDAAAYFSNENIIVAGDTIFNARYPFIDVEHGGSIKGTIAALDVFLDMADEDTIIVPGHGVLMTKSDLQLYRETLNTIAEKVEKAIKDGQTLEQIITSAPAQEFDQTMDGTLVSANAFITLIFEDLSR